jgi:hypothetical protein
MNSSVKGGRKTEWKKPDALKKVMGFFFLKEVLNLKCAEFSVCRRASPPAPGFCE